MIDKKLKSAILNPKKKLPMKNLEAYYTNSPMEEDFEKTVEIARQVGFAKMHVFSFSARKGTSAAVMEGVYARTLTDPVTGISVRLETIRGNKSTKWEFDILYGSAVPQAEGMVRVLG